MLIIILSASILILTGIILSWASGFIRQREYVSKVINGDVKVFDADESKNIFSSIQRLLGINKSSVEIAIEKLSREQNEENSKRLNPPFIEKLQRLGIGISAIGFYVISLFFMLASVGLGWMYGLDLYINLPLGLLIGYSLPRIILSRMYKNRLKKFTREFPNAIDVLVRGLRSGLPLIDCLKIISRETQEPVRGEFKKVINDQALGMPATDAVLKLADRVPTTEVNFLAIVIKIQSRTGGSLTEALNNLSITLRERRKLQDKIVAMSQEAKSSAAIIAAMPLLVALALYFLSPEYVGLLFSDIRGRIALFCSAIWMVIGVLIMKKMIDFEV